MNIERDILVVDDERDLCEVLQSILESAGYRVETASCAADAIATASATPFPLIFCDISMPGGSGLELVAALRERGLSSAVVMLTAHADKEYILEALRLGAADYVNKPFDPASLLKRLPPWLELGKRLWAANSGNAPHLAPADLQRNLRMIELFRLKSNALAKSG